MHSMKSSLSIQRMCALPNVRLAPPSIWTSSWVKGSPDRLQFSREVTGHVISNRIRTRAASPKTDLPAGVLKNGFVDYYEILQVDDDADLKEIKASYRSLAKVCHPDFLGDKGHDLCILLNEAYEVLSDPNTRAAYNYELEQALLDDSDGFTGETLSRWMANKKMGKNTDPDESRGVFVDENSCIGCKMCVWCASATFRIEPEYGRSRVWAQWLDSEDDISAAIDSCPVSCIHWVEKEQLPALEFVMQNQVERLDVGMMMAGQGGGVVDPFDAAAKYMKERKAREEKAEKARRYSPAQEAARREAADEIMKQNVGGFFAGAFKSMMGVAGEFVNDGGNSGSVGSRRRARRWDDPEVGLENGATIPPERALVPVYSKSNR